MAIVVPAESSHLTKTTKQASVELYCCFFVAVLAEIFAQDGLIIRPLLEQLMQ